MLSGGDVALLTLAGLAGVAAWAAIGVGLGAIIRNQVGAVITLLGLGIHRRQPAVRPGPLRRPFHAYPRAGRTGRPDDEASAAPGPSAVVLFVWVAGLAIVGFALSARRDIN